MSLREWFPRGWLLAGILIGSGLAVADDPRAADGPDGVDDATVLFARVDAEARLAARVPYRPREAIGEAALAKLDYDQYRAIRFRPGNALWRQDSDFEVQLFHPGFLFSRPVTIFSVENGTVREVGFSSEYFDYGPEVPEALRNEIRTLAEGAGFAGFRFHFPMNRPDYRDEVAVFLGASYFRLVGPGQVYGLSGRGLAIDTALPGGEEFPYFDRFWLIRPEPGASTVTVIAALESPSLTGAFRFDIHVTDRVVVDVEKRLHARRDIRRLGLAPLTSMFLFAEFPGRSFDDFRPRVHDSDGLQVLTGNGEWIWRPLANPRDPRVVAFQDTQPAGFGLVQRQRDFGDYLDLEAQYHRRPSHWVEPRGGDWGDGAVVLVELPADSEIHDNIVAFWEPHDRFRAGESRDLRYRIHVFDSWPQAVPGIREMPQYRVTRVRQGWGKVPGSADPPPRAVRRYVVDFAPGRPGEQEPSGGMPEARISVTHGEYDELQVKALPHEQGWRVSFLLQPPSDRPADIRLQLTLAGQPVSETWNHVWHGDEIAHADE